MTKTIFVVGCSYSHHDIYVAPNETWPSLLQEDLNCKIINCSVPGNSNLSYFYRLKELEEKYGKPDKVIVQLTTLHRIFFHQKTLPICDIFKCSGREYYYDTFEDAYRPAGYNFTVVNSHKQLKLLQKIYNIRTKDIKIYWKYFGTDAYLKWNTQKEVMLINSYFNNVTFFSWNQKFDWMSDYDNYLGDLKHDIISKKNWNRYSHIPKKDEHFNTHGHSAVKEIVKKYVQI